jgi:uncharacterized membrane protein YGL010W
MDLFIVKPFRTSLAFYRTRHRTPGCRLTHMVGVPLLIVGFATLLLSRKVSIPCLIGGVFFQILGHKLFEKNEPTLIETRDLMSIPASLMFVAELYRDVFEGTWIEKNGLELFQKLPISKQTVEEAHTLI